MAPWLVETVVASQVVLLVGWIATLLLRNRSAASRHLVWVVAFSIVLVLPVVRLFVPLIPIGKKQPVVISDVAVTYVAPLDGTSSSSPSAAVSKAAPPAVEWQAVAGWICAAGSAFLTIHLLLALMYLRRLRRRGSRVDGLICDRPSLARRAGLKRRWDLRLSTGPIPSTAMTWGVCPPQVLLPEEAPAWPSERLEAVMLHELAHVRRWDSVTQVMAASACALYWFSPVSWLCARAMRAEAEKAADQAVLDAGVPSSDYAEVLIRLASSLSRRRHPFAIAGVSIMKKNKIEKRIETILSPRARRGAGAIELICICCAATLALGPVALLSSQQKSHAELAAPVPDAGGYSQPGVIGVPVAVQATTTRKKAVKAASRPRTQKDLERRLDEMQKQIEALQARLAQLTARPRMTHDSAAAIAPSVPMGTKRAIAPSPRGSNPLAPAPALAPVARDKGVPSAPVASEKRAIVAAPPSINTFTGRAPSPAVSTSTGSSVPVGLMPAKAAESLQTQVLRIENRDPVEIGERLTRAGVDGLSAITPDREGKALVVVGTPAALKEVVKRILEMGGKLQTRPAETADTTTVRYALAYITSQKALEAVNKANLDGVTMIACDPATNSLIVRGTSDGQAAVKSLLAKVDRK